MEHDWRLYYEPMRPATDGYGWRMILDLQKRAPDGEWETVDSMPYRSDGAGVFCVPDAFIRLERTLAAPHGLDRRRLPIVGSPCARLFGGRM